MPLTPGTRLGPYEILEPLGAGGMGEVYKARDLRLDRAVAIKILPNHLAGDPEFRDRFDREARSISQLSHPNICALFDVGEAPLEPPSAAGSQTSSQPIHYLVLEHLTGETLEARLAHGRLTLTEAVAIAIDIAAALDAAHRHGIVHRDLKPGNIFLARTAGSPISAAKLLDFGLAKAGPAGALTSGVAASAMTTRALTAQGTLLGTFQYMAPEQIEGQEADVRTDIFAFGVTLYEMLTGRRAFDAKSQASLLGAILKDEPPPVSQLLPLTPPALDHLVRTCLSKDPDGRFQTVHDVWLQLKWVATGESQVGAPAPTVERSKTRERLLWVVTAASVLVALALAVVAMVRPSPKGDAIRVALNVPARGISSGGASLAVSPDGRSLAFVGNLPSGRPVLWVRAFSEMSARPLPGTDGARQPFWSPDSRALGFFAEGKLKKIDVLGGPPETLTDVTDPSLGGTWNREGIILFSQADGLYRVSNTGGVPVRVTTLDAPHRESSHRYPTFLPDGRHFLYLAITDTLETRGVRAGSLDSSETKLVLNVGRNVQYVAPGYLFFVREGTLVAQAFNVQQMKLTGESFAVGPGIGAAPQTTAASFSASNTGVLAYQPDAAGADGQLVWWGRNGRRLGTLGNTSDYVTPALSPDGAKVAVARRDPTTRISNIWIYDVERGIPSRITFGSADLNPVWSADGSRILFTSARKDVHQKAANGVGAEEVVLESNDVKWINDVSADGRYIVTDNGGQSSRASLWVWPLGGDRKPFPLTPGPFAARAAQLSHDNRWIAYASDEQGQFDVYVETFPEHRGKVRVSAAGGTEPMWRRDGKELFYLSGDTMMAVDVKSSGDQFEAGSPRVLFEAQPTTNIPRNRYVVSPDGQRFLIASAAEKGTVPITVVFNWEAVLKK